MKNYYSLFAIVASLLLASCYSAPSEEDLIQSVSTQKVTITTRAASGSALQYPIQVYALDGNGAEKAHQTLTSASDKLSLSLTAGAYKIVACSGTLDMPASGFSNSPIMMGSADVTVGSQPLSVTLLLAYQVCQISVSLGNLPSDASAVSLSIAPLYQSIATDGTLSKPGTSTVILSKSGSTWNTGTIYVYPGSGSQTTFSISVTSPAGTQTYGYTYTQPLTAATPYVMSGTYEPGAAQISGILSSGEWSSPVNISFQFGAGASSSGTSTVDSSVEISHHVIAYSDTTETQIAYTLISLKEETKVHSAVNAANDTEASSLAASYSEAGLTGWSIPTEDQARRLKALYADDKLTTLNHRISELGGTIVLAKDEKGNNVKYLCADATKTFGFASTSTVSAAGGTVLYSLRYVRTVVKNR